MIEFLGNADGSAGQDFPGKVPIERVEAPARDIQACIVPNW
jgi:hypothetical protein